MLADILKTLLQYAIEACGLRGRNHGREATDYDLRHHPCTDSKFFDMVVHRHELRNTLSRIVRRYEHLYDRVIE